MIIFFAGVCINCIAVALIVLNGIKDSLSYRTVSGRNDILHITGLVLAGAIAAGFYHKNNGNISVAELIVWLPAVPLVLAAIFLAAVMIVKPNWK